jgi:thioredoxin 1
MSSDKKNFQKLLETSDVPVLVDVYSDNCGPCHAMKPVLSELKQKLGDHVRIVKIDGYKNMAFMDQWRIQAFPTLMIFKKGKMVWSRMGFTPMNVLEGAVRAHA